MPYLSRFVAAICGCLLFSGAVRADETAWSLDTAVRRALAAAPEIEAAAADVAARAGELSQAQAWPNPRAEARIGDRLSREKSESGYDVTEYGLVQPLPFGRRGPQRRQAQAQLAAAEANRRHAQLKLESDVARTFHALQATTAKWELARERLQIAEGLAATGKGKSKKDVLVRYLTPLERLRLGIIHATARQALDTAEGEMAEARARFRALLVLPEGAPVSTALAPPALPITIRNSASRANAMCLPGVNRPRPRWD